MTKVNGVEGAKVRKDPYLSAFRSQRGHIDLMFRVLGCSEASRVVFSLINSYWDGSDFSGDCLITMQFSTV